jgi:4-hydroxybenzoate polyprenyltransferase
MNSSEQTGQQLFLLRLGAYLNERFPAYQVVGQLPLFLSAFLAGQAFVGARPTVNLDAVVGFVAFVAYTFAARALDDHKDFEHDSLHYPERVLQRGLITLRHLKVLGLGCVVVSLLGSLYIDQGLGLVTLWWLVTVVSNNIYQFWMMRHPETMRWIEERRVLLAFTFLPFWGLGSLWIAQMGAKEHRLPWSAGWLVVLWVVGPLLLEFARKSRAPEDERSTVVDYTKPRVSWAHSLGLGGAVVSMILLAALTTALEMVLLWSLGYGSRWAYAACVGVAALCLLPAAGLFAASPSRRRAKLVAELSSSVMVLGQVVLVVAMLVGR